MFHVAVMRFHGQHPPPPSSPPLAPNPTPPQRRAHHHQGTDGSLVVTDVLDADQQLYAGRQQFSEEVLITRTELDEMIAKKRDLEAHVVDMGRKACSRAALPSTTTALSCLLLSGTRKWRRTSLSLSPSPPHPILNRTRSTRCSRNTTTHAWLRFAAQCMTFRLAISLRLAHGSLPAPAQTEWAVQLKEFDYKKERKDLAAKYEEQLRQQEAALGHAKELFATAKAEAEQEKHELEESQKAKLEVAAGKGEVGRRRKGKGGGWGGILSPSSTTSA